MNYPFAIDKQHPEFLNNLSWKRESQVINSGANIYIVKLSLPRLSLLLPQLLKICIHDRCPGQETSCPCSPGTFAKLHLGFSKACKWRNFGSSLSLSFYNSYFAKQADFREIITNYKTDTCVKIPAVRWVESHLDWSCKTASTEKQAEMGQEFKIIAIPTSV